MLKKLLTAFAVAIAVTASGNIALAQSDEENAQACDRDTMVQSATLKFNLKTIAFLVGVPWGEGVLTLNDGFQLTFDVSGAKLLETGIANANFEGEVYNLNDIEDFEGTYWGASTKAYVGQGQGRVADQQFELRLYPGPAHRWRSPTVGTGARRPCDKVREVATTASVRKSASSGTKSGEI